MANRCSIDYLNQFAGREMDMAVAVAAGWKLWNVYNLHKNWLEIPGYGNRPDFYEFNPSPSLAAMFPAQYRRQRFDTPQEALEKTVLPPFSTVPLTIDVLSGFSEKWDSLARDMKKCELEGTLLPCPIQIFWDWREQRFAVAKCKAFLWWADREQE